MNWQDQLISVYISICSFFDQLSFGRFLKISPNSNPTFTDQEAMTIYIFGIMKNHKNLRSIHRFFSDHLRAWFPSLPNYEGLLRRINSMNEIFSDLSKFLLNKIKPLLRNWNLENHFVVDSMPIIMAKDSRSTKCKTANELANKGYCASKKTYYYGVKFHLISDRREGTLAAPRFLKITGASMHDLTALKEDLCKIKFATIFADKAYIDSAMKNTLARKMTEIHIPIKLSKSKTSLDPDEVSYSKTVSSFRQSIEIFFSWINERTGIQTGSKVRSKKGLLVHVFGRFSAALYMYFIKYRANFLNR